MTRFSRLAAALASVVLSAGAMAETAASTPVHNLVRLSASATVDVRQDLLTISMGTTREGAEAAAVQNQLRMALESALAEARKLALPGELDVRTGNFSLYPRYGRDGKMTGWQGTTELILEGRDFARISATAGKIQTLTLGNVSFGLSREQRAKSETEAQAMAIERFKARATDIARGFGFGAYSLREVSVSANDQNFAPRPRVMAMEARAAMADAPVPVEAGKSAVVVTVSGSVQLK
jgi:predicted secreted protein